MAKLVHLLRAEAADQQYVVGINLSISVHIPSTVILLCE